MLSVMPYAVMQVFRIYMINMVTSVEAGVVVNRIAADTMARGSFDQQINPKCKTEVHNKIYNFMDCFDFNAFIGCADGWSWGEGDGGEGR